MSDKPVRIPGPDHPISITAGRHATATVGGRILAETDNALELREADYPAVLYFPRADVDMVVLEPTDHSTYCPYKGDCSYFTIAVDGDVLDNAVWSYESPYPAVAEIASHVAFYRDRVAVVSSAE